MERNYIYIGLAVLVVLVLAFVFWPKPGVVAGPGGIPVNPSGSIVFLGTPLSLSPVQGEDVPCVGTPDGYWRAFAYKNADDQEIDITVGYLKRGDDFEAAKNWVLTQLAKCGYSKDYEEQGGINGIRGHRYYFKVMPNENPEVAVTVAVIPASATPDQKEYTFIGLEYYNNLLESDIDSGESYGTGDSSSSESSPPQDVPVTGALKEWDDTFRPILKAVFGEPVVLTSAANPVPHNYGLDYALPCSVKAEDSATLLEAFTNAGWQQLSAEQDQTSGSFALQKGKTLVQVDYDVGGDVITVTVFEGQ
jgi:hypothetical protein